jgi:Cys-tRNA(Pro)/Cys-tRNA(Cys) deacylase
MAFPVFFEEAAQGHATISVSAGVRGTQIFLAAADYVRATRATVAAISRPKAGG